MCLTAGRSPGKVVICDLRWPCDSAFIRSRVAQVIGPGHGSARGEAEL